ncbi:XtrA/YqaO family protein [Bacillus pumilus]|uniref:XtrA/YqaO family protein n=1 Tax=Bacillus pumilus TaxID=1408 RepID=UPI002281F531|nr:XtrA/YqaO family protein [Bacillus pumilus]MCY7572856.1 XtrA/YqaO family protein [Bacillus pumilus]MCY7578250.1 XtrA/YqaO family protein [Bacillus pumilus]MEC3761269.1 XtrA/YqaO family protein [Bacillus pumilus]
MRLQDIPSKIIDIETLDTKEPIVLVFSDGILKYTQLPPHGEIKIVTHNNKVTRVIFNEGELFE